MCRKGGCWATVGRVGLVDQVPARRGKGLQWGCEPKVCVSPGAPPAICCTDVGSNGPGREEGVAQCGAFSQAPKARERGWAPAANPYIKQRCSPRSGGSAGGEAAGSGVCALLPGPAHRKLMVEQLLRQLPSPELLLKCPRAVHLCVLLTWNNTRAIGCLLTEAGLTLHREVARVPLNDQCGYSEGEWEMICLGLSQIALQGDHYVHHRANYWGAGQWSTGQLQPPPPQRPGVFAYNGPITPAALGAFRLLGLVYRSVLDSPQQHGSTRGLNVHAALARFAILQWHRINGDLQQLMEYARSQMPTAIAVGGLDFASTVMNAYMQAMSVQQPVVQQQQQQQAPQQQVQEMEEEEDEGEEEEGQEAD